MSDPRDIGLGWPFVALDEDPFVGVEIAPNSELILVCDVCGAAAKSAVRQRGFGLPRDPAQNECYCQGGT